MEQSHARSNRSGRTAMFQAMKTLRYAFFLLAIAGVQSWSFSFHGPHRSLDTTKLALSSGNTNMDRRQLLHQIVLSTATCAPLLICAGKAGSAAFAAPLIPETTKATATVAKDRFGSVLLATQYLSSKPAGDRSLVLGLKDEPTYLIVNNDKSAIEDFALNAECSHLGCIVPWNEFEKKFECPCHGSKYDAMGNVLRGPAPYALSLAHVTTEEDTGRILLSPWTEVDFRTNESPWWK